MRKHLVIYFENVYIITQDSNLPSQSHYVAKCFWKPSCHFCPKYFFFCFKTSFVTITRTSESTASLSSRCVSVPNEPMLSASFTFYFYSFVSSLLFLPPLVWRIFLLYGFLKTSQACHLPTTFLSLSVLCYRSSLSVGLTN